MRAQQNDHEHPAPSPYPTLTIRARAHPRTHEALTVRSRVKIAFKASNEPVEKDFEVGRQIVPKSQKSLCTSLKSPKFKKKGWRLLSPPPSRLELVFYVCVCMCYLSEASSAFSSFLPSSAFSSFSVFLSSSDTIRLYTPTQHHSLLP